MKVVFLGLAKHQIRYFEAVLQNTSLRGRVLSPADLPFPSVYAIPQALRAVEWKRLVAEKCTEREIKGRYNGLLYRFLLRLELFVMALRFGQLIRKEKPDAVAVWNGGHRYCSLFTSMCDAGVLRLYFENGLLPGTTTLDPQGVNYKNSVPRDPDFYLNYAELYFGKLRRVSSVTLVPRETKKLAEPIALPDKYIFIPFQDDFDTQIRLFSPWIRNMRELFSFAELVAQRSGRTVVLKEHPSSRVKYPDLIDRASSKVRFANGNSTQELIEKSDCVVTINSSVGLESIFLGKPVLVLGNAFYAIKGVAACAQNSEEAIGFLEPTADWQLDEQLRLAFVSYLREEYCLPGRWQEGGVDHYSAVVKRVEALVHE